MVNEGGTRGATTTMVQEAIQPSLARAPSRINQERGCLSDGVIHGRNIQVRLLRSPTSVIRDSEDLVVEQIAEEEGIDVSTEGNPTQVINLDFESSVGAVRGGGGRGWSSF
ncbi:hypothetical protein Scep_016458 [Stephania cephalantha]|uniref:Uncharacterized protein n=1 Tax=Stephania cephalantha TaxID=152367 RepID=A0AAP0INH8_9MAGN